MNSGLLLNSVRKLFGDHCAVDGIDLEVPEGEVVALLGPSGCGKTTTLRCVAGLETPTSGEIEVGGRVVYSSRTRTSTAPEKRGVGLVFQSYALWPHLSVAKNVEYGLKVQGVRKAEIHTRTDRILRSVGLHGYESRHPGTLSGGQQQRVALARSLVMEPRVLLFDEPLSNLDLKLREVMRRELRQLVTQIGLTSLYVTHDQTEAMVIADRIVLMNRGRVEQIGTPREIYERPATEFAASFIGSANVFSAEALEASNGSLVVQVESGPRLELDGTGGGCPPGADLRVAIRPERVSIVSGVSREGVQVFDAEVLSAEFLGSHTVYEVSVAGLRLRAQSSSATYAPGDSVQVQLSPEDLLLVDT